MDRFFPDFFFRARCPWRILRRDLIATLLLSEKRFSRTRILRHASQLNGFLQWILLRLNFSKIASFVFFISFRIFILTHGKMFIITRQVCPDLTDKCGGVSVNWVGVALAAPVASVRASTSLPLAAGGLGLRSALRLRHAAHWASWCRNATPRLLTSL